jgi:hypothetical protein
VVRGYFPHYYLGLTLYRQGRIVPAVDQWRISQAQGQLAPREAEELRGLMRAPDVVAALRGDAPAEPADAPREASRLDQTTLNTFSRGPSSGSGGAYQNLDALMAGGRRRSTAPDEAADQPPEAAAGPAPSGTTTARNPAAPAQPPAARAGTPAAAAANRPTPAGTAAPPPPARANAAPASAQNTSSGSSDRTARDTRIRTTPEDLESITAVFRGDSPPSTPPWLRAAAQAYFGGRYRQVIPALRSEDVPDRIAAQRELLRAAALYAEFLASGEAEALLESEAMDAAQACHQFDPSVRPDLRLFSPKFLRFFERALEGVLPR